jgi:hypothetical protein
MCGFLRRALRSAWCRRRSAWPALLIAALAGASAAAASEQQGASTSSQARQDARQAIPLKKIDPAYQKAVAEILADPSIFRRLPTDVVDCRPKMFTFLALNPEVLAEIWRDMGLSRVELTRTGANTFDLYDHAGTKGKLVVVEQSCDDNAQNRIVMYAEGVYDGKPFQRPVSAQCVLLLRSGSVRETNERQYVAARLDSVVKLDRTSIELLAQAVHPFIGRTADRNFADTLSFVSNLSYTAEKRPEMIEKIAADLDAVEPARRDRLVAIAHDCAEAGKQWETSRARQVSLETPAAE